MANTARCGGHITLLFTVDKAARLKRGQGSTGAGFSIHHGVEISGQLHLKQRNKPQRSVGITPDVRSETQPPQASIVHIRDMHGRTVEDTGLYLDYIEACRHATLLREDEWLELEVVLECPTSQGFGMSAAGLLALGTFIQRSTNRGTTVQYQKIAHRIEREHGAGLGDVLGMSVGGIELRTSPGAPGWPGQARGFHAEGPILLVWDDVEQRHTSTYIDHPDWQRTITAAGQQGVEALASGPWDPERWSDLLEQSRHFATASGMLSETKRLRVYNTVLNEIGLAGLQSNYAVRLCMLGNSVAVVPRKLEKPCETEHLDALAKQLDTHGISAFITRFGPLTHGA